MGNERSKERLKALLSKKRVGFDLNDAEPLLRPAEIGAKEGRGYKAPGLEASIYFFDHQSEHAKAIQIIKERLGEDILASSNGDMLMVGIELDKKAHWDLASLLSAFSGDE